MLKSERQQYILHELERESAVHVAALAETLDVNPVTIRRDLTQLEEAGHLQRVHGGAILQEERAVSMPEAEVWEKRIAEAAARFIPDTGVVFIGPGTLTVALTPYLQPHSQLTLITNALDVAWNVARMTQHTLHILGGEVTETYGIYRDVDDVLNLRADWVILESGGLDAERGLTHDRQDDAQMARALFKIGAQVMILLPPRRVGAASALYLAPANAVDVLVTGREAKNAPLWHLSELGVRIVLA